MVPAAVVDRSIEDLIPPLLEGGDIVIDSGNSIARRCTSAARRGWPRRASTTWTSARRRRLGLERGYCMMIGGEPAVVQHLDPLFVSALPGIRHPPAPVEHRAGTAEQGLPALRPRHSGALRQMVHNGAECGLMATPHAGDGRSARAKYQEDAAPVDAETTPLRDPAHYQYDINLGEVAELAARGRCRLVAAGSPPTRCSRIRRCRSLPAACPTPARAAGRSWRQSTKGFRRRCSRPRCTRASARAEKPTSRTSCFRRCASSSADTWKNPTTCAREWDRDTRAL